MKGAICVNPVGLFLVLMLFVSPVSGMTIEKGGRAVSKDAKCAEASEKYAEGIAKDHAEERRAAFQKAIDLCPSNAEAHNNLADALEKLGVQERAKKNQEHWNKGNRLLDEAVRHYSKALEIKPDILASHLGLGDVYMIQGRFPLAVQQYKKVLELRPDSNEYKNRLKQAEKMALDVAKGIKTESQILQAVKNRELQDAYTVMGIENYTVTDVARESFDNILFEGWSSEILPGQPMNQLNEIGKALSSRDMANFRFVIEGHANKVGGPEENMTLSQKRSRAVKDYLVAKFNIDPGRIITQGFGYDRIRQHPATDPRNRRVEVVFFVESGN